MASESTAPVGLRVRLRSSSMRAQNNCQYFTLSLFVALLPPPPHCSWPLPARLLSRSLFPCSPPPLSALLSCVLARFPLCDRFALALLLSSAPPHTRVYCHATCGASAPMRTSHLLHAVFRVPSSLSGHFFYFMFYIFVSVPCLLTSQLPPAPRYRSHFSTYDGQLLTLRCFAPFAACSATTPAPAAFSRLQRARGPPQTINGRRGARPQALLLPGSPQSAHPLAESTRSRRRPCGCRPHPGA